MFDTCPTARGALPALLLVPAGFRFWLDDDQFRLFCPVQTDHMEYGGGLAHCLIFDGMIALARIVRN